jgi:hypothetical protein
MIPIKISAEYFLKLSKLIQKITEKLKLNRKIMEKKSSRRILALVKVKRSYKISLINTM